MVAQPHWPCQFTRLGRMSLFLEKTNASSFAHHLSHGQIKLFMTKGERISRFVAEVGAEDIDLTDSDIARHPFYRAFFQCWNEQRYYEAHDVLEQLWLKTGSDDANFFKGLIQAAGAFVHLQKRFEHPAHPKYSRRLPPAVRLFRLAEKNLSPFAPRHHGLDVAALCQLLRAYADQIVASDYKVNPWSPETARKLELCSHRPAAGPQQSP
jgi:predicted metal-dependent hydrolase